MRAALLGLLLIQFLVSTAQLEGRLLIDSLHVELKKNRSDSSFVKLYNSLSSSYIVVNPDSGIIYAQLAFNRAKDINWSSEEVISLLNQSVCLTRKGEYNKALKMNFIAQEKMEELNDDVLTAKVFSNLGYIYLHLNDYQRALEYCQKSIQLGLKTKDFDLLISQYNAMGLIYSSTYKNKEALFYYQKAIELAQKKNNKTIFAYANSNSGSIYQEMGEYRKALDFHFKALVIEKELNDIYGLATEYGSISVAYREMSQQYPAKRNVYLDSSIYYGNLSIDYCIKCDDNSDLILVKKELGKTYAFKNNYKKAYQLFSESIQLKDSLFSSEQDAELRATEKKQLEKVKEVELAKQRQLIYFSSLGGLIMLVFASIFFFQRNKIKKEKKRSDELLLNILPEEVAEELKQKGSSDAKAFDSVTILFTDFKGFTQVSEKLSPHELVEEIDFCFRAFDKIIEKYNIEKIKTIGDAYMCAGGLPIPSVNHAEDVIRAAIEIRDFIHNRKEEKQAKGETFFEIRIGVHTGNVVAGIVGIKKFAYDIWGDAVNLASRMESSSEPGKINISETTYSIVKEKFECHYRGKIEAKNKGEINMYFVEKYIGIDND